MNNKILNVQAKEFIRHGILGINLIISGIMMMTGIESWLLLAITFALLLFVFSSFLLKKERADEMAERNSDIAGNNTFHFACILLMLLAFIGRWLPDNISPYGTIYLLIGISKIFYTGNFLVLDRKGA